MFDFSGEFIDLVANFDISSVVDILIVGGEEAWKGIKLFQELGCYGCHSTEGFGEDENRMIAPDLSQICLSLRQICLSMRQIC